jgi:DNA-binding NarL/FixJ family response regulator
MLESNVMVTILAVEDEKAILSSIVDILELDNYDVLTAHNGELGIEIAREQLPDLIISDVMMPKVDGYKFFQVLQEDSSTSLIPFMFLTALATYDDIREGMNLGADDYIVKPFNYRTLSTAVRTRLHKHHSTELARQLAFTHRLVDFQENERSMIARQINGMIGEPLHALRMLLSANGIDTNNIVSFKQLVDTLLSNLPLLEEWIQPSMISQLDIYPVTFWLIDRYRNQHNLTIEVEKAGYNPIFDPRAKMIIYRIFDEILTNIISHSRCKTVFIRLQTTEEVFHAEIMDDGQGFLVEQAMLMDTLGLKLIQEYATLLNGELNIHSIPQSGTTIALTLPVYNVDEQSTNIPETNTQLTSVLQKKTISVFLIDKQDIIRQGLIQILSNDSKLEVVGEANSAIGIHRQVDSLSPDVIILDMSLEDQSSIEILQELKARYPSIKLICFSTFDQAVYAVEALQNGGDGYILKSTPAVEILTGLRAVISGQQYICTALVDSVMNWTLNYRNQPHISNYDSLTERERLILKQVLEGLTSAEIADKLTISSRTVEKHRSNFMKKLNLKTPAQLMRYAAENEFFD